MDNQIFLAVLSFLLLSQNENVQAGLSIFSLRHCCGLGRKYATSGLECNSFQPPIAGIQKEDESSCIHSIEVCCTNEKKELQCHKGMQDAKIGLSCSSHTDIEKDCCDACALGIEAGKAKEECVDTLGLGAPSDKAFVDCCKNYDNIKSAITSTSTSTTTTTEAALPKSTNPASTPDAKFSPLPPIENVCDIGDVCAQICIPTGNSYKCDCNKGFKLMGDGISCKPDKRATSKNSDDRCYANNPCDHVCTDNGVAVKCTCHEGYELNKDKRTCKDIDECKLGIHECAAGEVCVNDEGGYYCDDPNFLTNENPDAFDSKCPTGYKFDYEKQVCDDINECEFDIICPRPKTCVNTIGSFKCEGDDRAPQCPPGFQYKPSVDSCTDIDECLTGENDCNKESQVCLNTKGNYTCVDKASTKSCPPGFKKNPSTQKCDDINECEENDELCAPDEQCVNEPGGHTCVPKSGARPDNNKKVFNYPLSTPTEPTLPPMPTNPVQSSTTSTSTSTTTSTTTTVRAPTKPRCPKGYKMSPRTKSCVDIDECEEDEQACDSTQECFNSVGSYVCQCKSGFSKDYKTGACTDINECQLGTFDCSAGQRCDNTVGSYVCSRIAGCGTGYTLSFSNGLCEDNDECALGTHNCNDLGPNFRCRNTLGSYRCESVRYTPPVRKPPIVYPTVPPVPFPRYTTPMPPTTPVQNYPILSGTLKKCLPGYQMNQQGVCEDINECESNPCPRGQKCFNYNGRYQCLPTTQCKLGYELDDSGENCIDINECTRGTHKCKSTQICKNGQGFYTCECPPGHHINPASQQCEDIDECKYYRACGANAECINTVGSYKCRCKEGLRGTGNFCDDIDECSETKGLCEHNCVNIWGSYRCACKQGHTLNFDNRTCTDIDECDMFKDKRLCVGTCENIPGSYKCTCPKGYRLGSDGRTCQDIDECLTNTCPRHDDVCLNTRGSYKCYSISCPENYYRDPEHKGRCKRMNHLCDPRDVQCILMPEQYTYHFITFVSNLPILKDNIQFFQINGPTWTVARAEFSMKVVNVNAPVNVERVTERFFKVYKPGQNMMKLYLTRSIAGPQEIELKVEMRLYQGNALTTNVVAYLYIVVSEYPF